MLTREVAEGLYILCKGQPQYPAFLIQPFGEERAVRDSILAAVHLKLREDHPASKLWSVEDALLSEDAPPAWLTAACRPQARGLVVLHDLLTVEPETRARLRTLGHLRALGAHALSPYVAVVFAATAREAAK